MVREDMLLKVGWLKGRIPSDRLFILFKFTHSITKQKKCVFYCFSEFLSFLFFKEFLEGIRCDDEGSP